MSGYIVNFTVYTMAMLGLIFFAVFIYKKVTDGSIGRNNTQFLSVEQSLSLNPRKTLHIVKAGDERFLIASDVDRTTLISKLNDANNRPMQDFNTPPKKDYSNIEKYVDEIYPEKLEEQPVKIEQKPYFEHVDFNKKPNTERTSRNSRKGRKVIDLDFATQFKAQSAEISPMQEMARRINQL